MRCAVLMACGAADFWIGQGANHRLVFAFLCVPEEEHTEEAQKMTGLQQPAENTKSQGAKQKMPGSMVMDIRPLAQGSFTSVASYERLAVQTPATQPAGDSVDIHEPRLLTDEEAEVAMAAVHDDVQQNSTEALSVHGGLSLDRVMALLQDI